MPARSKAQQRLFGAAAHNADFPLANKLRDSMTLGQLADFASGSMQGKPEHVTPPTAPAAPTTPPPPKTTPTRGRYPHANLGGYLHPKKRR